MKKKGLYLKDKKAFYVLVLFVSILLILIKLDYSGYLITLGNSVDKEFMKDISDASLVLDMPFDNDTNSTVIDNSLYGNNGTGSNVTLTSENCFNRRCYSFSGVKNYIDAGNGGSLNISTGITISAWVKPSGKRTGDYSAIVSKRNSYDFEIRQDGIIIMYLTGVRSWVTSIRGKKDLYDGAWHHLVGTYDGSYQKIYIDNVLIDSISASGSISLNSNVVKIGSAFKGKLDGVRIYNRSLTGDEVGELFHSYDLARDGPRTYYISSSLGNDNNDGLSEATPWKNIDMIRKRICYPNMIIPGDSILLKRGDVWEGQIPIEYKGVKGDQPITISAYGPSNEPKPLIYGDGRGLNWAPVENYSGVYEAYLGVGSEIYRVYQGNNILYGKLTDVFSLTNGSWGHPNGETDRIWVKTSDGSQPVDIRVFRHRIIKIQNCSNMIIENLDLQEGWIAAYVISSDFIILRNLDILNTQDIAVLYVYDQNCTMENFNTTNAGNTALYINRGSKNTVRNCTVNGVYDIISGINTSGSDNQAIGLQSSYYNLVEYNKFLYANNIDYFFEIGTIVRYNYVFRGGIYPHGTNLSVYGNIANLDGVKSGMNWGNTGSGQIKIYNNIFYLTTTYALGSNASGPISIRNNIIYSRWGSLVNYGANVDSDYNCFYCNYTPQFKQLGLVYSSLSSFQSATGKDRHSLFVNPQFVSAHPLSPEDFQLNISSPCIDAGEDVGIAQDYSGSTIPRGSAPDIGAFEYTFRTNLYSPTNYSWRCLGTDAICNLSKISENNSRNYTPYRPDVLWQMNNTTTPQNFTNAINPNITNGSILMINNESSKFIDETEDMESEKYDLFMFWVILVSILIVAIAVIAIILHKSRRNNLDLGK